MHQFQNNVDLISRTRPNYTVTELATLINQVCGDDTVSPRIIARAIDDGKIHASTGPITPLTTRRVRFVSNKEAMRVLEDYVKFYNINIQEG